MNGLNIMSTLVLVAVLAAACDRRDGSAGGTAPPAPAPAGVSPTSNAGANSDSEFGSGSGTGTRDTGTSRPTAGDSAGAGDDAAAADVERIRSHLADADRHLKNNKPDLARRSLREAELVQGSLPVELRDQIRQLRSKVAAAAASAAPPPPPPAEFEGDDENK